MSGLPPRLAEFLDDLTLLEARSERYALLIEYADRFQEVPERIATRPFPESHRVRRCESQAYVWVERQVDGGLKLHFAVENPQGVSAKAMAVILDETLSGETPAAIVGVPTEVVLEIFGRNLSMGKGQGLMGMVELTRALARADLLDSEQATTR